MKVGDTISYGCNRHNDDRWRLELKKKGADLSLSSGLTHLATVKLDPESIERLMSGLADVHEALSKLWPGIGGLED